MTMNTPETAPKDRLILADAGYPWPVLAIWNPAIEKWATTMLEASDYLGKSDLYFVTEYEDELRGWCEPPAMAERKQGAG